jgi:hypothetical protein
MTSVFQVSSRTKAAHLAPFIRDDRSTGAPSVPAPKDFLTRKIAGTCPAYVLSAFPSAAKTPIVIDNSIRKPLISRFFTPFHLNDKIIHGTSTLGTPNSRDSPS